MKTYTTILLLLCTSVITKERLHINKIIQEDKVNVVNNANNKNIALATPHSEDDHTQSDLDMIEHDKDNMVHSQEEISTISAARSKSKVGSINEDFQDKTGYDDDPFDDEDEEDDYESDFNVHTAPMPVQKVIAHQVHDDYDPSPLPKRSVNNRDKENQAEKNFFTDKIEKLNKQFNQ